MWAPCPGGWGRDCLALGTGAVVAAAALRPFHNVPFIDDWVYAWSVRHLLETGELAVVEYSTSPQLVQTLWGSLFSLPFGFSFTALRISTWTLWVAMLCGLYLLIRELGGTRRNAMMGAAAMAVHPIAFILAFTFMTDIPFLAGLVWSVLFFVQGLRCQRGVLVWAAALAAGVAIGSRPIGIGIPAAMFMTLLLHPGRWGRRPGVLLAPIAAVAFTAALFVFGRTHVLQSADMSGVENSPANRLAGLSYAVGMLDSVVPLTLVFVVAAIGMALLPIAFAHLNRRTAPLGLALTAGFVTAWSLLRYSGISTWGPLGDCEIWSLSELGAASCLVPNNVAYQLPPWFEVTLAVCSLTLGGFLLAAAFSSKPSAGRAFILWLLLSQLALASLLWLYHFDRYALVFAVLIVALAMAREVDLPLPVPAAALGAYALVCVLGVHDHLEYSRALWRAVDGLRTSGVPSSEINAGYVVNGWLQYTYPKEANRDASGEIAIPWVNSDVPVRFAVSNRRREGADLLRTIPYNGWLYPDGQLFVLEQAR